jgi:DNA repair exonuclease SbcCD ATPase subunit
MQPLFLKLENFFSHKESEVDFKNFNSALLLGSTDGDYSRSNGSGKSAIFESILWCLFNKSRAAMMDDVIHWGENKCSVTFDFLHDGKSFRVKRTRLRATSTSTVDFMFQDENGKWVNLSGSTSGDTNDKICSTIKLDYKTFINSAYFRQNDISEFSTSEASRKKEILKSIVDISRWDLYEKESKKKLKEAQNDLVITQTKIDTLQAEINQLLPYENNLNDLIKNIETKNSEKESLSNEVEILSESYSNKKSKVDTDSWDRAVQEIFSLKQRGKDLKTKYESLISTLEEKSDKKSAIDTEIQGIEKQASLLNFDPDVDEKMSKNTSEIYEYTALCKSAKEKIKELELILIKEGECYTCHQNISHETFSRLNDEHNKKIEFVKKKKENAESRLQYLKSVEEDLTKQLLAKKKLDEFNKKLPILKFKSESLSEETLNLQKEKDQFFEELTSIKNKIIENDKILDSLKDEDFQNLINKLKEKKEFLSSISSQILELSVQLGTFKEKSSSLEGKRKLIKEEKDNLSKRQDRVAVFDKMTKMFGKNGIQTILLDVVISDLEKKSNEILQSICNDAFSICLETQRQGSDGVSIVETLDLNVKKDGSLCNFYSLSGGEQFRIALALRIALSEIASNHGGSSLEFLLLDEINSPLDKSGVETLFVNVIKSLESKYKMLVITHDDSLKERFDSIIEVQKINGESSATFSSR